MGALERRGMTSSRVFVHIGKNNQVLYAGWNTEFLHKPTVDYRPGIDAINLITGKRRLDAFSDADRRRYRKHANGH